MTSCWLLHLVTSFAVQELAANLQQNEVAAMEFQIEEFDPYIFVIHLEGGGGPLRIHARWFDGSEEAKMKLDRVLSARLNKEMPFIEWLRIFDLDYLGAGAVTKEYLPMPEKVDPPEKKHTKAWLAIDGVKGDWEVRRTSCKDWEMPFDELHEDVYTLLGARNLTMLCEEYLREYLLTHFDILPSDKMSLAQLKEVLRAGGQEALAPGEFETNENFTNVIFRDIHGQLHQFEFTPKQALIVRELALSSDPLGERDDDLLSLVEGKAEFRNLFKEHPAWKTFVIKTPQTQPTRRRLSGKLLRNLP